MKGYMLEDSEMLKAIKECADIFRRNCPEKTPEVIFCSGDVYSKVVDAIDKGGLSIPIYIVD